MVYVPGSCLQTKQQDPLPRSLLIYGQQGAGKTTLAATASEFYPETPWAARSTPLILKDMMWLQADNNGLVSLAAHNIFPAAVFNLYEVLRPARAGETKQTAKDIDEACLWFSKELEHARDTLGIKWVVIDTLSTLCAEYELLYIQGEKCPVSERSGVRDMRSAWTALANRLTLFRRNLIMSGVRYIYLAHPSLNNAEVEAQNARPDQRAEKKARAVVASSSGFNNDIVPLIPGKTGKLVNGEVDLGIWLEMIDLPGKPLKHVVYPQGGNGAQGKSRYIEILGKTEPANLRAIEQKILNHTLGEVKDG